MHYRRSLVNVLIVLGLTVGLFAAVREVRDATARFRPRPLSKALAHYTMGIIYDNDGKFEKAIAEYKKSISYDPDVGHSRTRLAIAYMMIKDEASALAELERAKALDPADMRARFTSSLIHTSSNRFDLAQKECEEMVRIDPESIWALSSLADVYVLQEKMTDASRVYEKLLEKEESSVISFNLGIIYSKLGETDRAIEKLEQACRLDPEYLEAYVGLGALYEARGDLTAAISSFERALKVDPLNDEKIVRKAVFYGFEAVVIQHEIDHSAGVLMTDKRAPEQEKPKEIGRNAPCYCGSDRKYKKCCMAKDEAAYKNVVREDPFFRVLKDAVKDATKGGG